MSGILKRAEGRPRPWTWVEVANDQIVTNFRNFFYVFACPSCGAESGATAEIIREMMAGDRQGRCPQCYEGGAVANFWEVQMPIADLTIAGPLPEGSPVFRVRLYGFPRAPPHFLRERSTRPSGRVRIETRMRGSMGRYRGRSG